MTDQSDPNDRDEEDDLPSVNPLRRVLRLLVGSGNPDSGHRSVGGGLVGGEIRIGSLEPTGEDRDVHRADQGASRVDRAPRSYSVSDPHVDTRSVKGGTDVIVDLKGTQPDDLTVAVDPVDESILIDAPGHRRRWLPIPDGHEVADTHMRNGILEIRLRQAHKGDEGVANE